MVVNYLTPGDDPETIYYADLEKVMPIPDTFEKMDEAGKLLWCYENWRCGGVSYSSLESESMVMFITENGNGKVFAKELSRKFPEVTNTIFYSLDSDSDDYRKMVFKNGEILHSSFHTWDKRKQLILNTLGTAKNWFVSKLKNK